MNDGRCGLVKNSPASSALSGLAVPASRVVW